MTIEDVNRFQDLIRSYNNAPVPYVELAEKCAKEHLDAALIYLKNNHYIAVMKDGNTFINWSSNKYYPEATIINLKAELTNSTRAPTLEEKLELLVETVNELTNRISKLEERI